jgi:hypothetical protein
MLGNLQDSIILVLKEHIDKLNNKINSTYAETLETIGIHTERRGEARNLIVKLVSFGLEQWNQRDRVTQEPPKKKKKSEENSSTVRERVPLNCTDGTTLPQYGIYKKQNTGTHCS